ncbi:MULTISPECIES: SURF1 family protein [unclassified Lysobacter]|uniref:SURF1 family protein n=1 Tax=unclassified Lysobacter TaxID=2635362 RepID=UPI000AFD7DCA|nr:MULTISPECIES: SURF1 family protein [unclassified Lysobacter]
MSDRRHAAVEQASGRRPLLLAVFASSLLVACAGFLALGGWQVQRMAWKHDLIARVEARLTAPPAAPPAREQWAAVTEERDGYRRVRLSGRFLPALETRSQAVTELGAGAWVLVPLRTDEGDYVLVNRGFVPAQEQASVPPAGQVQVEGLLRMSEPKGGFLRSNDPAHERWYSRDVAAIARARKLPGDAVAPYFVDAVRGPADPAWPRGGLTVVKFRDHHLSYALTWFGLAALSLVAGYLLFASERRLRQDRAQRGGSPDHASPIQSP